MNYFSPFPLFFCAVTIFFICLFLPDWAMAEEKPPEVTIEKLLTLSLEELIEVDITVATGTPKSIRTAPAVASVITADEIEAMGAATMDEALETVPGLHVYPSFGSFVPGYTIRGIQTVLNPQVLVLVNGLPITHPYNGRRIVGLRMGVSNISRIEVVRGPGSAVHGADAFAGTINVITKEGKEIDGVKAGLRVGSFDTFIGWAQYGGEHKGWDTAFNLEYQESRGDRDRIVFSDLQTTLDVGVNDPFGQPPASLAPGKLATKYHNLDAQLSLLKDNWTFRLWGSFGDDIGPGGGSLQALDDKGDIEYQLMLFDLIYENDELFRNWDMSLRLSYLYQHSDTLFQILPPGALVTLDADGVLTFDPASTRYFGLYTQGYIGEPIQTDTIPAIDYAAYYRGFTDHLVRFGTGYKIQDEDTETYVNFGSEALDFSSLSTDPFNPTSIDGTLTYVNNGPSIYLPDQRRELWYVSLQDEWGFAPHWELTAGIRYDHYSDFGDTTNPRLALVWETRSDLTTKVLYGSAFRPPSFAEGHNQNNPVILGNPDLKPETIDTWELAFDYQPSDIFRSQFNLFYYDIEGLIDYVTDPGGATRTAQNAKDQEGHGFELEADWIVTRTFLMKGNVAYQHSKDKNTDEVVADTPQWQTYLNGHWNFVDRWSLDGQWFWIGDRKRAAGDPRKKIDDYSLFNLTLRRKDIAKHWDLAFQVRNLFDEDIREPSNGFIPDDYPMEGRSFWGEVRFHVQ